MSLVFDEEQRRRLGGRGRTLFERLANLGALEPADDKRAETLLETWIEVFSDREAFEHRLEARGLSEIECRAALDADRLAAEEPIPGWVERLESLVADIQARAPPTNGSNGAGDHEWLFKELSTAIVEHAREGLSPVVSEVLSPGAIAAVCQWFRLQFERRFSRLLYAEFKETIASSDPELAHAEPADFDTPPTDHYEAFVEMLFDEGFGALCLEYPVFARLLVTQIHQWQTNLETFCHRIEEDRERLQARFDREETPETVTALQPLADDTHAGGQAVMRVTFDDEWAVIYKPRSVEIGETFYRVLDRLDEHLDFGFRAPTYLPRDGYGWMEEIEYAGCADTAAVERYYQRVGAMLCLAYFLEFRDVQVENVRTAGEYPVVLDAETICHPYVSPENRLGHSAFAQAKLDTILLTDMIVTPTKPVRDSEPLPEIEATAGFASGGDATKIEGFAFPNVVGRNTDVMNVEHRPGSVDRRRNIPRIDGAPQPPGEYVEVIDEGFTTTYETILELREEDRLAEIGLPTAFAGLENRIVCRPTMQYFQVLNAVTSQECLRDGARLGIELERLVALFDDLSHESPLWELYEAELEALTLHDPPRFTARTDATELRLRGSRIDFHADVAGLDRASERIRTADRSDLGRQREILRGALGAAPAPAMRDAPAGDRQRVDDERFLSEARSIVGRLRESAVELENGYGWVTPCLVDERGVGLRPDDGSLYTGRTGIAILGAAMYRLTGEERYRTFARRAIEPTLAEVRGDRPSAVVETLGGTNGLGSFAYGLAVTAELLEEPAIIETVGEAVSDRLSRELIETDETFDVVGGSAGTILGVLGLYDRCANEDLLERAVVCGEHLLENRIDVDGGCAWPTAIHDATGPVTGFSRGASGIAYALIRLWNVTGTDRYRDVALDALAFEDAAFSSAVDNWDTLRASLGADVDRWCWGRTGIGLARLGMTEHVDADRVADGFERAIAATSASGLPPVDQLCCGAAGRATFLLEAERRLGRRKGEAREILGGVLTRKADLGAYRLMEGTNHLHNPSLYRGEAGIGYAMLRVVDPEALPCLLLWE